MKQLITSILIISLPLSLYCQIDFQIPRHADGRVFASEKFEMMEKLYKLRKTAILEDQDNPINDKNNLLKSVSREMQVGDSGVTEAELHAVVNPNDPNNIVVGVINLDADDLFDPIAISIYVTYDLGISWAKSDFSGFGDSVTLGGGDPMFAFDNEGGLFFSWLKFDASADLDTGFIGLYMTKSLDGGMTWVDLNTPIAKYDFTDLISLSDLEKFVDKQWMAGDLSAASPYFGNVYIAYLSLDVPAETYDIVFQKKEQGVDEFDSVEVKVSHDDKILAQFVNIEVDNQGNIFLVYLADDDTREDRNGMYFCMSSDGGNSFSAPQLITEFHFPDFGSGRLDIDGISSARLYPCPQLGVDRSGGEYEGRIYLTFTAYGIDAIASEGTDVYLMYSSDQGQTWSEPKVINDDSDPDMHQYYSSITVTEAGQPAIAWYDRRNDLGNDSSTEYYLGYSDDGGDRFEQFKVSSFPTNFEETLDGVLDFGIGEYNEIVCSGDFIIPFWTDGRTDNGDLSIYAYFYNRDGTSVIDKSVILSDKISVSAPLPNPSTTTFSFSVNLKEKGPLKIELYSADGSLAKKILEEKNHIGERDVLVEIVDFRAGIYLLSVATNQGVQTRKIIIE